MARKRSTAIITKLWDDTEIDMSLKNGHILHKIRPPNPDTCQVGESATSAASMRVGRNIAIKISEAAMLAIRSMIVSFILL